MNVLAAIGEGLVELRGGADQDELHVGVGGDAANVCVMAARAGASARLASRVGDETFGTRLVDFWHAAGVDVRWILRDPGAPTGVYLNEPTADGHRFSYWRNGSAGSRIEADDIPAAFLDGVGILLVTGITLAISTSAATAAYTAAARARSRGARVAFVVNHRPQLHAAPALVQRWARSADILIFSDEDAAALPHLEDAGDGDLREIVRTAGAAPATVRWSGGEEQCAIPAVPVIDAAGAGDALAGAYLAGRLAGVQPAAALARAVTAASLSVGRIGCAASYPSADELESALGAAT